MARPDDRFAVAVFLVLTRISAPLSTGRSLKVPGPAPALVSDLPWVPGPRFRRGHEHRLLTAW